MGVRLGSAIAFVGVSLFAQEGFAQGLPPALEPLFQQGRRELANGSFDAAIASFERVNAEAPSVGAYYSIGSAHLGAGRPVAAWAAFTEAARVARAKGDPREADAREKAAELETKLPRLIVRSAPIDLTLDIGGGLRRDEWSEPLRRPPGAYRLVARARCKVPFESTIKIAPDGSTAMIVVPDLADDPACDGGSPEGRALHAPAPRRLPLPQRTLGFVLGGVGVVALGTGIVFGGLASASYGDVREACSDYPRGCDPSRRDELSDLNDTAQARALTSTIAITAGVALVIGGVVMILTDPNATKSGSGSTARSRGAR